MARRARTEVAPRKRKKVYVYAHPYLCVYENNGDPCAIRQVADEGLAVHPDA
jgi:hypothetical protein